MTEIETVERNIAQEWGSTIEKYDYSLFITPSWIESFRENGYRPVYIDFVSEGSVIAKIAGIIIGKPGAINYKLTCYAGPALLRSVSDERLIKDCLFSLLRYSRTKRINRLVVLSYDYSCNSHDCNGFAFEERNEYIVNLQGDWKEIERGISRNIKRNVKKASALGYRVSESNAENNYERLVALLGETKRTRREKGYGDYQYFYFPNFDAVTMSSLMKQDNILRFLVVKEETAKAMLVMLSNKRKAYGLFIGVHSDGYRDGIPAFLNYSVMRLLKKRNFEQINLGGIPTDATHQGLIDFKKKLGGIPHKSLYGSTNFLLFPYVLLNPLVRMARMMPDNRLFRFLKKYL